jgi:hypothetical protein
MMENTNLVKGVSYDTEPEKVYLILIVGRDLNDDEFRDWEFKEGRQDAYDYIKNYIESGYSVVDIYESKIIVSSEKVKVTDGITIYEFMKAMKENDKVIDYTSFDIEDYANGDVEGE